MRLANRPLLYISGPMTGIPDYNFPAFNHAAADLRREGYQVENPAEHFNGKQDLPYEVMLAEDVFALMTKCWGLTLLPGWSSSHGARLEVAIADKERLAISHYAGAGRLQEADIRVIREVLWTTMSKTAASVKSTRPEWSASL